MKLSLNRKVRSAAVLISAILLIVAANLAVFEAALGLYFYYTQGELIWTRTVPPAQGAPDSDQLRRNTGLEFSGLRLSPYFGYVNDAGDKPAVRDQDVLDGRKTLPVKEFRGCDHEPAPGPCKEFLHFHAIDWEPDLAPQWMVNECGFASGYPCPYSPPDNALVVGIFGGSVAQHYAFWAADSKSSILKELARRTGRRLVILPFTVGGGKQPLQTQALAYALSLGQRFDVVINLDGYNEVYISWLNATKFGIAASMPFAKLIVGQENLFADRLVGEDDSGSVKRRRDMLVGWSERTRSAIVHYLVKMGGVYYTNATARLEQETTQRRADARYLVQLAPAPKGYAIQDVMNLWINGSISMAAMASAHGAAYIHVLQPSQYYSNRRFTAQEVGEFNVLGQGDAPLREIVPEAYDAFRSHADKLKAAGVRFVDATGIFETDTRTIYYDWCCHFNHAGNQLLDQLLVPHILAALQAQPAPPDMPITTFGDRGAAFRAFDVERLAGIRDLIAQAKDADLPAAEATLLRAVAAANSAYAAGIPKAADLLLDSYLELARLHAAHEKWVSATGHYRSALAAVETFVSKAPSDRHFLLRAIDVRLAAAPAFNAAGDKATELALYNQAAATAAQFLASDETNAALQQRLQAAKDGLKVFE